MPSSATLRREVETALCDRVPAALTLKIKQAPELFATGVAEVDQALGGGIPRGSLTEVSGLSSTGKTSLCLATVAAITQSGAACAWVDVGDSLSPESAAAARVQLRRLLWLRIRGEGQQRVAQKPLSRVEQGLKATDLLLQAGGFAAIVLDMSDVVAQHTQRIPLATWYRFRLAAEQARTALMVVTQVSCASSCAALVLQCEPAKVIPFREVGGVALFCGQRYTVLRERNRNEGLFLKRPPMRAEWDVQTPWTRVR